MLRTIQNTLADTTAWWADLTDAVCEWTAYWWWRLGVLLCGDFDVADAILEKVRAKQTLTAAELKWLEENKERAKAKAILRLLDQLKATRHVTIALTAVFELMVAAMMKLTRELSKMGPGQ